MHLIASNIEFWTLLLENHLDPALLQHGQPQLGYLGLRQPAKALMCEWIGSVRGLIKQNDRSGTMAALMASTLTTYISSSTKHCDAIYLDAVGNWESVRKQPGSIHNPNPVNLPRVTGSRDKNP